jgi:hypothetical protein
MSTAAEIVACAQEYIARRERLSHPAGSFDRGSRWYPDDAGERQACCNTVRWPSRAWPYALMTHCRTLNHTAAVFSCDPALVRRAVKLLEAQHPAGSGWTPEELEQVTAALAVLVARKRLTGKDATPAQARKAAGVAAAVLAAP